MLLLLPLLASAADVDPLTLALDEGQSVTLSLVSQLTATARVPPGEEAVGEVAIGRLRADAQLAVLDDRVIARTYLNLSPGSVEVVETWLEARPTEATAARVGVLKVPFTTYRETSFAVLGLVDWSPVTRAFGSERQLGAMAMGSTGRVHGALALTQGQGSRTSHGLGVADVWGETPCSWSDLAGDCDLEGVAPEVVGRLGWASEDTPEVFDWDGGPVRGAVAASGAVDSGPEERVDLASRGAVEGTLAAGHVVLLGGGYLGWAEIDEAWRPALVGARGEVTGAVAGRLGLAARASWVQALPALEDAARPWETVEVIGGPTVRLVGDDIRWQVDGGWQQHPDGDGVLVRTLLQAGF